MTRRHVSSGPTPPDPVSPGPVSPGPASPGPTLPGGAQGLYGPQGWSVETGVWTLLAPWVPSAGSSLRRVPAATSPGPGGVGWCGPGSWGGAGEAEDGVLSAVLSVPGRIDGRGAAAVVPVEDYVPFRGLDAATARELLSVLPGRALSDRQNRAPCLAALMAACADADGSVRLSGYGIGPQRQDERLSVEAMWVGDTDLADYDVDERHGPGCQCESLWRAVARRYRLDARDGPDEVLRTRPEWAGGAQGWRLWWD